VSDDMDLTGVSRVDPEGGPGPAATKPDKRKGFFSTALGRALLIGLGVAVILGIIGVVVVLVLGVFASNTGTVTGGSVAGKSTAGATGAESSATAAASVVPSEPPLVPVIANRDVFSPRDPFEEIKPPVVPSETVKVEENVLVLKDIVTEDGVRKGVFTYNGVQYVGGPGDVLGRTNWKVLAVYESSADVLFGDDRVTLSVGQGIQK
jgi:hypothetical protein